MTERPPFEPIKIDFDFAWGIAKPKKRFSVKDVYSFDYEFCIIGDNSPTVSDEEKRYCSPQQKKFIENRMKGRLVFMELKNGFPFDVRFGYDSWHDDKCFHYYHVRNNSRADRRNGNDCTYS